MKNLIIKLLAVLIFNLTLINYAYGQVPLAMQQNFDIVASCDSSSDQGVAYEKEEDFSGLKLKLILLDKEKCYAFKTRGFFLEASQLSRIKIKASSSAIDCQRWLDEERFLCEGRIEELETRHAFEIKKLTLENENLLKEKHKLKLEFDEFVAASKEWSPSYSNIGIGLALGVVSSIVIINAIQN